VQFVVSLPPPAETPHLVDNVDNALFKMTFDTMKISKKEPIDLVDDEFLDSLPDSLMLKNQELKPYTIEMAAVARALTEGSNSKFKTSLGRSSHWTTIEEDQLARRLDVSAHRIFEFGIAVIQWSPNLFCFPGLCNQYTSCKASHSRASMA
jgi:hypothetical protein